MEALILLAVILLILALIPNRSPESVPWVLDEAEPSPVLEDMADDIREAFPKLVPHIQGPNLIVIHRERGVIITLTEADQASAIAKVVVAYGI